MHKATGRGTADESIRLLNRARIICKNVPKQQKMDPPFDIGSMASGSLISDSLWRGCETINGLDSDSVHRTILSGERMLFSLFAFSQKKKRATRKKVVLPGWLLNGKRGRQFGHFCHPAGSSPVYGDFLYCFYIEPGL